MILVGVAGSQAAKGFAEFGSVDSLTNSILSWLGAMIVGGMALAKIDNRSALYDNLQIQAHP